jgi:2-isopropylmalate synthase
VRDTTFREGDEQPGVFMTPEDKLRIAEKVFDAGVREAETGYVGAAQEHYEAAKLIKKELPGLKISTHARAWVPEWKREVDRGLEVGTDMITVLQHPILNWASDEQLIELGCPREEFVPRIVQVIEYAKSCGANVEYGHCDAFRSKWEDLEEFFSVAEKAGCDRLVMYEDGYCAPPAVKYLVRKIKKLVQVPLLIHCHDDLGLGTANTLAAIEEGAEYADLVVNGMGDKGGLTRMEEVVVALAGHYGIPTGINLEKLYSLSKLVEKISGVKCQPHNPIVGDNCFIHESELHAYCIIKGLWEAMEPVKAETVGQKRQVIFGSTTLHGESARARIASLGLDHTEDKVNAVLAEVRKILPKKHSLTLDEFDEVARRVLAKAK